MNLLASSPIPFERAVQRHADKIAVPSHLRTEGWSQVPAGLRDRAFFSAGVTRYKDLERMQGIIDEALTLNPEDAFADRSRFVADMRAALGAPEGDSDRLTDLASRRRLEMIYDFQVEDAYEYGRWKEGQDPDLLDAFPARELVRVEARNERRDWRTRWADAGGRTFGGRMIALKGDPIWTAISRFGRPWPPFDFGSGMGVRDIDRGEAEDIGLIAPDAPAPAPEEPAFNEQLEQSVSGLSSYYIAALIEIFEDQVELDGQTLRWVGGEA